MSEATKTQDTNIPAEVSSGDIPKPASEADKANLEERIKKIEANLESIKDTKIKTLRDKLMSDLEEVRNVLAGDSTASDFAAQLESLSDRLTVIEDQVNNLLKGDLGTEEEEKKEQERVELEIALSDAITRVAQALLDIKLLPIGEELTKKCRWVLSAVKNAFNNRNDDGFCEIQDSFNNKQKEGIPVDDLIDVLNELSGRVTDAEDASELKRLAKVLFDNSKGYFELRPDMQGDKQHWRTNLEAWYISKDYRHTGNMQSDYELAMRLMSKRRELILPKRKIKEVKDDEENGTMENSTEKKNGSTEPTTPEDKTKPTETEGSTEPTTPEDKTKPTETEGREKSPIDIPVHLIKEILSKIKIDKEMIRLVFSMDKSAAIEKVRNIFDDLNDSVKAELEAALDRSGYSFEEFLKLWKEGKNGNDLAKAVVEALASKIETARKNKAQERLTLKDRLKANWKTIAKRALLVAGAAGAAAITGGALLGSAYAVGLSIFVSGFVGRLLGRDYIKHKTKYEEKHGPGTYGPDAEMLANLEAKTKEYEEEIALELAKEIEAEGLKDYFGSLISQGILELTSNNPENANSELLKSRVLKKVVKQLESEGKIDAAQAKQLEYLVDQLSLRKNLVEAAREANASPVVIKILEGFIKLKSGSAVAMDTDSNIRNIAAYLSPLAVGGVVTTACSFGSGTIMQGIRMGLAGLAGGYGGYKLGEMRDQTAQKEAVIREIKNIINETEEMLSRYHQGAKIDGGIDLLKSNIRTLEGHINIGSLDSDILLKTRAEALVREGRREIFELDKEDGVKLENLLQGLKEHRSGLEAQARSDIQRIIGKTRNWRRWVGLAGGAVAGVLVVAGFIEARELGLLDFSHKGSGPEIRPLSELNGAIDPHNIPGGVKYETLVQSSGIRGSTMDNISDVTKPTPETTTKGHEIENSDIPRKGSTQHNIDRHHVGSRSVGRHEAPKIPSKEYVMDPLEIRGHVEHSLEVRNAGQFMADFQAGVADKKGIILDFPREFERTLGPNPLHIREASILPEHNGAIHIRLESGKVFDAKVAIGEDGTYHLVPVDTDVANTHFDAIDSYLSHAGRTVPGTEDMSLNGRGVDYVGGRISNIRPLEWEDMEKELFGRSGLADAFVNKERGGVIADNLRLLGARVRVLDRLVDDPLVRRPAQEDILRDMRFLLAGKLGHQPTNEELFQYYSPSVLRRLGIIDNLRGDISDVVHQSSSLSDLPPDTRGPESEGNVLIRRNPESVLDTSEHHQVEVLSVGGREVSIPIHKYDIAGAQEIVRVKHFIEDMPYGPKRDEVIDSFVRNIDDPERFHRFADSLLSSSKGDGDLAAGAAD